MDHFNYVDGQLMAEGIPLADIAAQFGTPAYVYSRATIERHWHAFDDALGEHPHLICYAVKANGSLGVLNVLARLGSGFDIVSVGELERVLTAGGDPAKIVFSGVGKRSDEIQRALEVGIHCFNVESEAELERINRVAERIGKMAAVSIRVNPDVDAGTHPYISTGLKENKFGIDIGIVEQVYLNAVEMQHLQPIGIDCHIGSQLTEVEPFLDALDRVLQLADRLSSRGIKIQHLDLGGGLGIRYQDEEPPLPAEYAEAILQRLQGSDYKIILEPGRAIMGNAGVLLMQVEYLKDNGTNRFAIVDAAMNDNMRPCLYSAWQEIQPVKQNVDAYNDSPELQYDIVGPICETGDFLAKQRALSLKPGDLLAMRSSGAYGFSMSSQYNARPRVPEIMVDGRQSILIRARETIEQLMQGERVLPS